MNKIVASYDSLHYCQCDIGRKQKQTERPISCKQLIERGGQKEENCKDFWEELHVFNRK